MASIEIELDLPSDVELRGYERIEDGHAFEVSWTLPDEVACEKCGHHEESQIDLKSTFRTPDLGGIWLIPVSVLGGADQGVRKG